MKKNYIGCAFVLLLPSAVCPKSVITDESIALQEVWESPETSLKTKFRIFYHDLRQPWPWSGFMESINEFYRINEELKRSGKKVSLKDRALVRVYNNKQRFRTLLWVATLIISDLALYVWHDKGKRMFPRSLGLPIILTAVHNANFLGLTPEKLKQGDWERTINSAARKKKGEHHPDVARYSGVEIIYPNVIEEKAKQLKLFLKEATLKNKTFFFDILEGIEAEKH